MTQWIDDNEENSRKLSECREGIYVRVIGDPKLVSPCFLRPSCLIHLIIHTFNYRRVFNETVTMTVFNIAPLCWFQ